MILDNASYHTAAITDKHIVSLDLPIMFLGPYSYLLAPIELYWGLFKFGDLNVECHQVSKSKYPFFLTNHFQSSSLI